MVCVQQVKSVTSHNAMQWTTTRDMEGCMEYTATCTGVPNVVIGICQAGVGEGKQMLNELDK